MTDIARDVDPDPTTTRRPRLVHLYCIKCDAEMLTALCGHKRSGGVRTIPAAEASKADCVVCIDLKRSHGPKHWFDK